MSEYDYTTAKDLRETANAIINLLDQLDELSEAEAALQEKKRRGEELLKELHEDLNRDYYAAQRQASRWKEEIERPKSELAKLRRIHYGYDSLKDTIEALEKKIEANKSLEAKRAALLSKPVSLPKEAGETAQKYLNEIKPNCAKHDEERKRIHSEIVHLSGNLAHSAKALSWYQGHNYPETSISGLQNDLDRMKSGLYLSSL